MKKLLALVALVAMVAVSSVAYAATTGNVTVSGTLGGSLEILPCTGTVNPMTLVIDDTISTTCINDYASNDPDGYALSFSATQNDMLGSGTALGETIDEIVAPNTTCASTETTLECFSYTFTVDDPEVALGAYGVGLNGTVDSNEDDVPLTAAPLAVFTSDAADEGDDTYTFTFNVTAQQTTAAGTYALNGGVITIAGL